MSLDVYLRTEQLHSEPPKIFIRRNGQNQEITRAEWDALYPGREPYYTGGDESDEVFHHNITHNLHQMAIAAGLGVCLWEPETMGITKAEQLIEPLRAGLAMLKSAPAKFRAFNPDNGWGNYEGLVEFVEDYLVACEKWPDAIVSISR